MVKKPDYKVRRDKVSGYWIVYKGGEFAIIKKVGRNDWFTDGRHFWPLRDAIFHLLGELGCG